MTCIIFSLMFRPIKEKLSPEDEEQAQVLPVNAPTIPDIVEPATEEMIGNGANDMDPPSYFQVQGIPYTKIPQLFLTNDDL